MLQLQIEHCHRDDVESLSDALEAISALSITLSDNQDHPILEPELGTTPLWPSVVIQALFEEEADVLLAKQILSASFPNLSFSTNTLLDQDWERVCLEDFKPQQFGKRLWVCPSWLTPPEPDAINLSLDPGLAFGTGTHPTTSLCLTWLEQATLHHKNVIDYGCGSGILAIAALKLGAMHAHAVDIDAQALLATKSNAANNHITEEQLTIGFPDTLEESPVDLLIANILLSPLIALQARFRQLLNDKGILVVSGIMADQVPSLIEAYASGFHHNVTVLEENWALIEFSRR